MNDRMIEDYVERIFRNVTPSERVTEQKEELVVNIRERVGDYMHEGLSFDAAFDAAKNSLGDTDELTAPFEKMRPGASTEERGRAFGSQTASAPGGASYGGAAYAEPKKRVKIELGNWGLAAVAPFAYVIIGLLQDGIENFMPWFGVLDWWSWGWAIIPITAILSVGLHWKTKLVALAPIIFVLIGLLQENLFDLMPWLPDLDWWTWGWVIIPLAALVRAGVIRVSEE